jgi:hypothetical protein
VSYDQAVPITSDRAIQMLIEAEEKKGFLYRTLFGNKNLPHVVFAIEHLTLFYNISSPMRKATLERFYDAFKNTLISTTSIDGKTMNILTETRIKQTTESTDAKKTFAPFGG